MAKHYFMLGAISNWFKGKGSKMPPAFTALTQHMDNRGFNYEGDSQAGHIRAIFSGKHTAYHLLLEVDEHLLQVFAHPGFHIPKGARPQLAEAICRANFGLKIGKFEMDFGSGQLRFQAATALTNGQLDDQMITIVMGAVFNTLDRYVPALLSCIFGNEPAEDAIRHAEAC